MKVLCPIDFSKTSINACYWIADFLSQYEVSELHLCHFINFSRRASMFVNIDDLFIERAEMDMEELTGRLKILHEDLSVKVAIYKADPKEGIVNKAKSEVPDLIVTGTSGLNAIKSMTIGSVTKYIFDHSDIPVLAIPANIKFNKISKIALAVDRQKFSKVSPLFLIRDLIEKFSSALHIIHVSDELDSWTKLDSSLGSVFKNIDFVYEKLTLQHSLAHTLSNYSNNQDVDLLCMIHHPKGWFMRLFSKSVTTDELFNLSSPLLVLRA